MFVVELSIDDGVSPTLGIFTSLEDAINHCEEHADALLTWSSCICRLANGSFKTWNCWMEERGCTYSITKYSTEGGLAQ